MSEAWLEAVVATPGLTAIADLDEARRMLLDDSLRGVDVVREYDGPIVDVGSGGGVPGIPLALALPEREVVLLEANGRKCEFLREWAPANARVVQGRAEEQATDVYGVAVAKALAPPPVAAEWCLPLVRPGGAVVLWVGQRVDREAVARGLEFDLLVTSGGVSVGPHDLVRRVEAELGVEEVFWRVAVRPGKPVAFGVRGSTLVFGLPGNPVSSLVACELLVKPAVLALQGASDPRPRFAAGRLDQPLVRNSGRDDLVRARVKLGAEGAVLQPVTGQESHMIVRAAEANALVLVPRGEGEVEAGALVRYLPL